MDASAANASTGDSRVAWKNGRTTDTFVTYSLRIGALSKLEVEQRQLRVVHLEFELANARLVAAKEQMLQKDQQLSAGEIAKTDVTPTENNLALAIAAAHTASAKREQADVDAAEANVHRQEKLYVLGSARKSDVARAQQKLADLRGQGN